MPLIVNYSPSQIDGRTIGIAEVVLAPPAPRDYKQALTFAVDGEEQPAVYAFRIVP